MLKLVMMPPQNDLQREWAPRLQRSLPDYRVVVPETEDEARREIVEADAAYGWIPPDMLPLATRLRWLQNPQAGPAPGYYYPELIAHPVVVCNPRGIYFDHISHHILMFILALSRGLPYYMEAQRQRCWDPQARQHPYVYLGDAMVLIVGVGGIGHETARLCTQLGMTVIGTDPRPEHEVAGVEVHPTTDLDTLLPRADFVITTTPHTPETEGMWHLERFRRMKPSAYFINIGRGKTTVLADLVTALEQGIIAGCGLDVYEVEPLPSEHPLWTMPNVLLTPHVAVRDAENIPERRFLVLFENAQRFASGQPLRNVVNKAMWY